LAAKGGGVIRLEGVTKRYGGVAAVDGLSLEVAAGETCVLVGPSGCGKTTTMKMVNRLIEPDAGRVMVEGRDVAGVDPVALRRRIGYVIQQIGLFPHLSVADNVATVPRLLGWGDERVRRRVDELLDLVGLDPAVFRSRPPHELSGGQRQRVGVARALGADPPVLLMDEPFGAVDPITRERLQDEFRRLQRELRKTVLFVTHDIDEAVRLGDRLAVLGQGGVLEQHGTPAEVLGRPASSSVASLVGSGRTLKRLGLLAVTEAMEPVPSPTPMTGAAGTVAAGATLAEALSELLGHDAGWVGVVDGGQLVGVVTLASIREALRRA
jgi:osmoprotectant transport system ATP-binding protein